VRTGLLLGINGDSGVEILQVTPPTCAVCDELFEVLRTAVGVKDREVAETDTEGALGVPVY
jgi:hypothetical protein